MTDLPAMPILGRAPRTPLSPSEVAEARARGLPLAFDPVLQGWVHLVPEAWRTAVPERPVLTIAFRAWTDEDLPSYRDMLSDPEVWRYLPEPFPGVLSDTVARDLLSVAQVTTFHEVRAAVLQGVPIGQVRLVWDTPAQTGAAHDPAPTSAEFSYWLGQAHWGRGYGRRIAIKSTGLAFARHPALTSLWARVHPDNRASRRILGEAGFAATGHTTADGWAILSCPRPAGSTLDRLSALANRPVG
ncbi:MAG: GNAT family N-acetyltransferase [Rhodobacteraceae bacterium]|jgi:RimJ/RimL family protein N-acetyltransferase|nr:GNAT family N-acetyltransferase [Paracoccaceae bacterium]